MELELFEKTEIWIRPVCTREVNLTAVAEQVARVFNLEKHEVMVIDVRDDVIALDILKRTINAEDILGKRDALLRALSEIPGVSLTPDTSIHSEGILGLIEIEDKKEAKEILRRMEQMGRQVSEEIRRRAIVFPSGFELQEHLIQDTNSPHIMQRLTEEGYKVTIGDALEDSADAIASTLRRAVNEGFGLIITTGGVGAEDKDRTIEGLLELDPTATTPYIIRYEKGKGRHEKDGVRIGVGYVKPSFIIALPGPNQEVQAGMEVIIDGLKEGLGKEGLAASLSEKYLELLKKVHHKP
jgi:molybdenum cofactor synthesis domain-containing protein